MKKAFIIHGAYGSPKENWIPWLSKHLISLGYEVITPVFPTPEGQSLDSWKKVFDGSELETDSIVIGHSLGVTFLLHLLEEYSVKAAYFISGFVDLLDNPDFDTINRSFVVHHFNWSTIVKNCPQILVMYGDNDPYVPEELCSKVASFLGVAPLVVEGGAHLNSSAGFSEFPLLLEKIKEDM